MKTGGILIAKSIDRLGPNYEEMLPQWRILTKENRIDIVILHMPLLDTWCSRDRTGTLIADIVLQLLSYIAQMERESIRARQVEGIAAAKARGVVFGHAKLPISEDFTEVRYLWQRRLISARKAGDWLGIPYLTFPRRARKDNK